MSKIDQDIADGLNIAAYLLLGNLNKGNGNKVALFDQGRTYNYSELISLVQRSAKLLEKLGLERENRLGILLPNRWESVVVFLGAIWLGAIPVPINPACSVAEINYILQDSRIKVLLTSQAWQEKLALSHSFLAEGDRGTGRRGDKEIGRQGDKETRRQGDEGTGRQGDKETRRQGDKETRRRGDRETGRRGEENITVLYSYLRHLLLVDGKQPFSSLLEDYSELTTYAPTSPDEAAFWLYTSGSTGRPKGVIHAHRNALVCIKQYAQAVLGLNEIDVIYSVANIAFAYGLGNSLYFPLAIGAASILSDAQNAFDIIDDLQRYRPTVFFGIPSVYARILELKEIAPLNASSLRMCVSAAEQLPKSIWQEWQEIHSLEICEGIGTTELLHIFLSNPLGESKPGSSGRPIPGYEVEVIKENGIRCEDNEIGELQVTGESLMLGYWNQLDKTRQAIYGNRIRTGDKYKRDRDGWFWFMGRGDDLFKVNGQWISPLEIESILYQHQQVLEVAVVPEDNDGEKLTEIVAYISLRSKQQPSVELERSLRNLAKQHLPHFKSPKQIYFVESLPRTSTGKVHRHLLKQKQSSLLTIAQ